ncbi:hypothetical protein GCM10027280_45690 [Micromonospora polyrhachis]|uniref:Excisionase family DNA binding protein n=1 Tax=Micromonospora polyrhachis TaxID=1282883 RepID=A0A7W7SRG7_9ACTN|nr:helix-turn-helix domain-containing protein [Micromonospora polyrhachis]MBB4958917.1 excisionase family DNA binding protein [Micromonospora polyrhachis]
MSEKWLTIDDLAELLNVKRTWVRDKVTARVLPHRRVGGVRFTPKDVAAIEEMFFEPAITDTPSRAAARTRQAAA